MSSDSIVDSRLSITLDLDPTLKNNQLFSTDPANRAHLANQLLIYDKVVIPTKDFGIIPILINWFGLKDFERVLNSGAICFIHKPGVLMYSGNGVGIMTFTMRAPDGKPFLWWQEAIFGDMDKAIDIQLKNKCASIAEKHRQKLVETIMKCSRPLQYDNDFFMKYIVHESYTDIQLNPELSDWIFALSGSQNPIDLAKAPGIAPNQGIVLNSDNIRTHINVILRVAEINMTIVIGSQYDNSDIFVPQGSETIIKAKLAHHKVSPPNLENFYQLLDLENVPDPGMAVYAGELSFSELLRIRQGHDSMRFRKWLQTAGARDVRELEKLYISSLGKKSFYDRLPTKIIRFAITTAADILFYPSGTALEIVDSFFLEKWMQGYSPRLFLDQLRKIQGHKKPSKQ